MSQKKFYLTTATAVYLVIAALATIVVRTSSARALEGEVYAIRGGTVVTVTGQTIQKGVVVIRDGLIDAVGADLAVPGDARVIDATGMFVYPGLFDTNTSLGIRPPAAPQQRGGPPGGGADPVFMIMQQMTAQPSDAGKLPEVSVVDELQIAANTFDQQRAAGITTALTAPRTGIFIGQSAIINLGSESAEKLILKTPFSLNVGFGGGRGGFPNSLMGVFAFLRQSLLDAQHYRDEWARYNKSPRGAKRPEVNKSLAALQPVINGEMPVIFNVNSVREIKRAIALAEEFNLRYMIAGATESYAVADYLKSKNATVLLSLGYPQKPQGLEDPEDEPLRILRLRAAAPTAAAALQKSGVRFAFNSGNLTRPSDYIANAVRAIEAGLPKDEALKALTIYPAQIFGLDQQLGSIEKGKIANLVLASGDIFGKDTRVKHVFIDGRKFDIKEAPTPRPGGGPLAGRGMRGGGGPGAGPGGPGINAGGAWNLTVNSPNGPTPGSLTVNQSGDSISGEIATPFGTVPITGTIRGNEISFTYTINFEGQQLPVSAKGRIEGNSISGTMEAMGQSFDFSGTRRPQE